MDRRDAWYLIGRIKLFEEGMWMVLNLKPLRKFALGKGVEGEASEIRQMRDIGKRWADIIWRVPRSDAFCSEA